MSEFYRVDTGANGSVFVRNTSAQNYVIAHSEGAGSTSITGGSVGISNTTPVAKFEVHDTAGELLSINNDLTSTVFSANDVSGLSMIEATANGNVIINRFRQGNLDVRGGILGESDCYTKLLIHSDINDANTCFIDSSSSEHTFTISGDTQHKTAQKKFGNTSISLPTGDSLITPSHADWTMSGEFTIDFWAKFGAHNVWNDILKTGTYYTANWDGTWVFRIRDSNEIEFAVYNDQVLQFQLKSAVLTETCIESWNHYAVTRDSNNCLYLWLNGVYAIASTIPSNTFTSTQIITETENSISIGGSNLLSDSYIDEFRISKGIARWTNNFIPPARPYSTVTSESFEEQDRLTTAVTALNNGNVGIGTTTPESQLHICNGSAGTVAPPSYAQLTLESADHVGIMLLSSTSKDSFIAFGNGTDNDYAGIYSMSADNTLRIRAGGNSDKITICSGGNVGIGTASPNKKLQVDGGSLALAGGSSVGNIFLPNNTGSGQGGLMWSSAPTNATQNFGTGVDASITYSTHADIDGIVFNATGAWSNDVVINKTTGNVGIGTTSPDTLLQLHHNTATLSFKNPTSVNNQHEFDGCSAGKIQFGSCHATYGVSGNIESVYDPHDSSFARGPHLYIRNLGSRTFDTNFRIRDNITLLSGGEVGFGTRRPTGLLDVRRTDGADNYTVLLLESNNSSHGNPAVFDTSVSNHHITSHGTAKNVRSYDSNGNVTTYMGPRFGKSSINLDGNSDYLSFPIDSDFSLGTGAFTLEMQIHFKSLGSANAWNTIFDTGHSEGLTLYWRNTTNLVYVYLDGSNSTFAWTPAINNWYHLAVVRDGSGNLKAFVNGTQIGSTATGTNVDASSVQSTGFIGAQVEGGPSNYFNGYLDQIRLSKGVARWTTTFAPPARPYTDSAIIATHDYDYGASHGCKVGIGTSNPSNALDVVFSDRNDGIAIHLTEYPTSQVQTGDRQGSLFFKYTNWGAYDQQCAVGAEIRAVAGDTYTDAANHAGETDLTFLTMDRKWYYQYLEEHMRIRHDGRISLGSDNSPQAAVQVSGNTSELFITSGSGTAITSSSAHGLNVGDAVCLPNTGGTPGNYQKFTVTAVGSTTAFTVDTAVTTAYTNCYTFKDTDLFRVDTGDSVNKLIVNKSGNVGIGTTSPDTKLHIKHDVTGTVNRNIYHSMFVLNPDHTDNAEFGGFGTGIDFKSCAYSTNSQVSMIRAYIRYQLNDSASQSYGTSLHFGTQIAANTTDPTDKMVIHHDGNVGIGTASPLSKLHVCGTAGVDPVMLIGSNNGNGYVLFGDHYADATNPESITTFGIQYSGAGALWGWGVKPSHTTNNTYLASHNGWSATRSAIRMCATGITFMGSCGESQPAVDTAITMHCLMHICETGNVGIGTASPVDPLEILCTNSGGVQRILNLANHGTADGTGARLTFEGKSSTGATKTMATIVGCTVDSDNSAFTSKLLFSTRTANAMAIDTSGNVGIGTTAPSANLHVRCGTAGQDSTFLLTRQHTDDYGIRLTANYGYGHVCIDSIGNSANPNMYFRMRTLGTAINAMTINGDGTLDQNSNYLVNSQTINDVQSKSSYRFDGAGSHLTISDYSISNTLSVEIWFKPDVLPTDSSPYQLLVTNPQGFAIGLYRNSSTLYIISTTSAQRVANIDGMLNVGQWHHLTVTYDSSGVPSYYLDTVPITTYHASNNNWSSTGSFIGRRTTSGSEFVGEISKIRIYDRVLTYTEVKSAYSGKADTLQRQVSWITDGGLETWTNSTTIAGGWTGQVSSGTVTQETTDLHGGSSAAELAAGVGWANIHTAVSTNHYVTGKKYRISLWAKSDDGGGFYLRSHAFDDSGSFTASNARETNISSTWTKYSYDQIAIAADDSLYITNTDDNKTALIDDVTISRFDAIAEFLPESIGETQWLDTSINENHGTVTSGLSQTHQNIFGGNVGIGTSSLPQMLTIARNSGATAGAGIAVSNLNGNNPAGGGFIDLLERCATFGANDSYGFRIIYDGADNKLCFVGHGGVVGTCCTAISITRDTGYVGIGCASPGVKLTVAGDICAGGKITTARSGNSNHFEMTGFGETWAFSNTSTRLDLSDSSQAVMSFCNNGNVGIGIAAPSVGLEATGGQKFYGGANFGNDASNLRTEINWASGSFAEFKALQSAAKLYLTAGNGTGRLVIDTDGNVGIGCTAPKAKLHIGGPNSLYGGYVVHIAATGSHSNYDPYITNITGTSCVNLFVSESSALTTGPDKVGLMLHNDDATAGGFSPMILFTKTEITGSPYQAAMAGIYARAPLGTGNSNSWIDGELIFATAGAATSGIRQRMVINKEGNVGIGNTTPGAPLHICGSWAGNHGQVAIEGPTNGLVGTALRSNGGYKGFIIYRDGTGGAKMEIGTVNSEPLHLQTNGHNNRLTILGGGNVGINTTVPQEKLSIKGNLSFENADNSLGDKGAIIWRTEATSHDIAAWVCGNRHSASYACHSVRIGAGPSNTDAIDVLTVNYDHNVGIGNMAPNSKLNVHDTAGELLAITNDLSDVVFSANDVSGLPMIQACADGDVHINPFEQGNLSIGGGLDFCGTDSYTKLLIHSDNSNGNSNITDSSPNAYSLVRYTGRNVAAGGYYSVEHSTTVKKFGSTSICFDGGTTGASGTWDWICSPPASITWGTGPYTVDFWHYRCSTHSHRQYSTWFSTYTGSATGIIIEQYAGYDCYGIYVSGDNHYSTGFTIIEDAWTHVAVVREGTGVNQLKYYINGIEVFSHRDQNNYSGSSSHYGSWGSLYGCSSSGTGVYALCGHMDEMRLSCTARWTENFTPPDRPYRSLAVDKLDKLTATMTGTYDGCVGIGNTAPNQKLSVIAPTNDNFCNVASFYTNNKSLGVEIHHRGIRPAHTTADGSTALDANVDFYIDSKGTGDIILGTQSSGNVGIGTTAPLQKLHVSDSPYGVIRVSDSDSTGNAVAAWIEFGTDSGGWDRHSFVGQGSLGDQDLYLVNEQNGLIRLSTGGGTKFVVNSAGNVGIGNTTPVNALVVQNAEPTIKLVNSTTPNAFESGRIRFTEYDTTNMQGAFIHYDGDANKFHIGVHTNSDAVVGNDNNAITIVRSTGNVGIGNLTQHGKLTVGSSAAVTELLSLSLGGAGSGSIQGKACIGFRHHEANTHPSVSLDFEEKDGGAYEGAFGISVRDAYSDSAPSRILTIKSGNVGIGTPSPAAKLDIRPANDASDTFRIYRGIGSGYDQDYLNISINSATVNFTAVDADEANYRPFKFIQTSTAGTRTVMTLDGSGNVIVAGHFAANTKSFDIPHPTKPDKRLVHGSLEGPEYGVYTRGQSCGCIVDLPDYWIGLVDPMSLTVQLTAKGKSQELWVECITADTVYVGSNVEDPDYFYFIQAERRDANKLEVEPDVEVRDGE